MKSFFILAVLLCGCVNKNNFEPEPRLKEDLTEQEISSLHAGITVTELSQRTTILRFSELDIPIFIIQIKDQPKMQCAVAFDKKSGRVLHAGKSDYYYGTAKDVFFLWPPQLAGLRATEENLKLIEPK